MKKQKLQKELIISENAKRISKFNFNDFLPKKNFFLLLNLKKSYHSLYGSKRN